MESDPTRDVEQDEPGEGGDDLEEFREEVEDDPATADTGDLGEDDAGRLRGG